MDDEADTLARAYDSWFDQGWGKYASGVERRALRRAIGSTAGLRVVDVGCGSGRFTEVLDQGAPSMVGLDLDPAMLALTRERLAIPVVAGDALALPLRDGSVDLAVAVTVLEFVSDPAVAVRELARVTRPGGRIVVGALNPRSPWGLIHPHELSGLPWGEPRFLTRRDLRGLGATHGTVRLFSALYAPGWFRWLPRVGPTLERIGEALPSFGAFQILVVERS